VRVKGCGLNPINEYYDRIEPQGGAARHAREGHISHQIKKGKTRHLIIKCIIDCYIMEYDQDDWLYIQEHILTNIHIIFEYMYTDCRSCDHWVNIYLIILDKFKYNPIIIDMVLGADYNDYSNDIEDIVNTIPSELLTYNFIINNLSNISISRLYTQLDKNSILLSNPDLIVIAVKYDDDCHVLDTMQTHELDTKENMLLILNSCEYKEIIGILDWFNLSDPDIQTALLECKKR